MTDEGHTWTKADIGRMQHALDFVVAHWMQYVRAGKRDEARARLRENAREIVREHLRASASALKESLHRERRAYLRIADRLASEPLPSAVVFPGDDHREPTPVAVPDLEVARDDPPAPARIVPDPARVIAHNLRDLLERSDVQVVRADSDAFGTDVQWADVAGAVSWRAWVQPIADELGVGDPWREHSETIDASWAEHSGPLTYVWTQACERAELPDVLSLVGVRARHGAISGPWVDALSGALRRRERGIVLVVDERVTGWALARCLPASVGA